MKIFRVSCEEYDRAWYVRTSSFEKAIEIIKDYTESLGWNIYNGEELNPEFEAEERFTEEDCFYNWEDM